MPAPILPMTTDLDPAAVALARLYDVDLLDDPGDLDLYLALAQRAAGSILELCVGSGRLAVPLAGAGWSVTGVDRDPAMLARAMVRATNAGREVVRRLELIQSDILDLDSPDATHAGHRLAILALNSIFLLGDRAAQAAVVRTLATQLAPGGIAVIDVWLPDADDLARYDGRIILEYARQDPESGRLVVKTASAIHDAASQTVTLTTIFDEGAPGQPPARWVRTDRLRLTGADELRSLAEAAGLAVEVVAGDYGLAPLGPGSERAILVAVRP